MKRRICKRKNAVRKILLFALALVLLTACRGVPPLSSNGIKGIPKGELLASYACTSGEYTVNVYLCDGGATTDYAIRGELVTNATGYRKNIYWNYHEYDAVVEWIEDDVVRINDHTLNIHTDVYDFRWD